MSYPLPEELAYSSRRKKRPPRRFQFSLATMLAVITAYSVLFSLLSWTQLRSYSAFAAIVVYFTAIAFSQWSFFEGRHPYWASVFTGALLTVTGALALAIMESHALVSAPDIVLFWVVVGGGFWVVIGGGMSGFFAGGLVDITLLLIEVAGGIRRKVVIPATELWPCADTAETSQARSRGRYWRFGTLAALVITFFVAVSMARIEASWRR